MGFDLDWIELDEDYYKSAKERFDNHKSLNMFEFIPRNTSKEKEKMREIW
ncbi:MAG: hypothetical protein ACOCW8_02070 [bacterium]